MIPSDTTNNKGMWYVLNYNETEGVFETFEAASKAYKVLETRDKTIVGPCSSIDEVRRCIRIDAPKNPQDG